FNGYNSGYFYYNKKSGVVTRFFDLFQAFTTTALNDENFRIITRQYTCMDTVPFFILDEQVLAYMRFKLPELFDLISVDEHLALSAHGFDGKIDDPRNIHMHAVMVENPLDTSEWRKPWNRGITPIAIQELFNNLQSVLSTEEIEDMYST